MSLVIDIDMAAGKSERGEGLSGTDCRDVNQEM